MVSGVRDEWMTNAMHRGCGDEQKMKSEHDVTQHTVVNTPVAPGTRPMGLLISDSQ